MSKTTNPKLIEHVSKIAAETAVMAVMDRLKKEKEEEHKSKNKRRLRNTKMLLRNYRAFKLHSMEISMEIDELSELLDLDDLDTDTFAVESIRKSKERTLAMVKFVDQMLRVYKFICEESGKEEESRKYQSVYYLYISDNRKTAFDISECHNTDQRTVYRDVDEACKTLSALIFGVDSLRFL